MPAGTISGRMNQPKRSKHHARMLTKIPLLTLLIFSVTYPLCFWISAREPLKNNFHHFHIGLPNLTAGLCVVGMLMLGLPTSTIHIALFWLVIFFAVTFVSWPRPTAHPFWIGLVAGLGLWVYVLAYRQLLDGSLTSLTSSVLAGLILSAAFYAMNLGHWYLNVHGLPLGHLKRATIVLGVLLGCRLMWDLVVLPGSHVVFGGEEMPVVHFLFRLDGLFLLVAFFFGTLFPLLSIYFVWGTLKAKSTQSATGILYVLLSAILIGDIAYKFYLLNYRLTF
jgi:hypothetical protein